MSRRSRSPAAGAAAPAGGGMRRLLCLATVLPVLAAAPTAAAGLCAEVSALAGAARSNFPDAAAGPSALPGAEDCALSLAPSGARAYHCAWRFALRDPAASDRFEAIVRDLRRCFGAQAVVTIDDSVNHPDTYDLRQFRLERVTVAVSIKDKGALESTYVFIRVYASDPG